MTAGDIQRSYFSVKKAIKAPFRYHIKHEKGKNQKEVEMFHVEVIMQKKI
jgi:hypothetical protein